MLKNNSFRNFFLSNLFMQFATTLLEITVMVKVYQMTSSIFITSMIIGLMALSSFFSGLIVTRFINKYRLKNILIITSIMRIFIVLGIYNCINLDFTYNIFIIMMLLIIQSFLSAWAAPARQSLIPLLFPRTQLRKVNTFISTSNEIISAIGWSLGGILSVYLSLHVIITIILISFIISVIFISFVNYNQRIGQSEIKVEGFQELLKNKVVLNITVVDALEVIANTIWTSALLLSFTLYVLNEGEIVWGQINATYFAGSIIGGLILIAFSKIKILMYLT